MNLDLSTSSMLQGVVAIGVAIGAILAAKLVTMRNSVRVLPLGIAMGISVVIMIVVRDLRLALALLVLIGIFSGFFVVPMNALLQHRGHILMGAGHSIAVQNFNENLSILVMTGAYSALIRADLSVYWIIAVFGLCVAGAMYLIKKLHEANQRDYDSLAELKDLGL